MVKSKFDFDSKLPGLLSKYSGSDFESQLKARFVYTLCLSMILIVLPILFYSIYIQLYIPFDGTLRYEVILPVISLVFLYLCCLYLLVKGHFTVSASLLLTFSFCCVWFIMLTSKTDALSRLDTIAYTLALLTLIPLFFNRKRYLIIFTIANMIFLFLYTLTYIDEFRVDISSVWDFLADTAFSMIFIAIVAYNIIRIHKLALDKANIEIRERENIGKALRNSEQRYKDTVDLLPQIIFEIDLSGNLIYVNKIAYSLYGYSEVDYLKGVNYLDFISPGDHNKIRENFRHALLGKNSTGNEYTAIKKDGSQFPVKIFSSPIIENNAPVGLRGLIIDMTEFKKAENAILESEQLKFRVFESSRIPIVLMEKESLRFIDCNSAAVRIFGFTNKNEVLGLTPMDISADFQYDGTSTYEKAKYYVEKAITEGSIIFEWQHLRPNGEIWDAEVQLMSFKSGENIIVQISLIEITERKKAEEALRRSEELHRKLLTTVPDLIIRTDLNGNITFVNEYAFQMQNIIPTERLHGKSIFSFISEYDYQRAVENTKLMFDKKLGPQEYELCFNESNIICEVNGDILLDSESKPTGMVYVVRDISERKAAENKIKESEERFRSFIESSVVGFLLIDEKGIIIEWNPAMEEITGYTKSDVINNKWINIIMKFVVPEKRNSQTMERFSSAMNNFIKTGISPFIGKNQDYYIVSKEGKKVLIQQTIFAVKTNLGFRAGVVIMDITESKQAETALKESEIQYKLLFDSANDAIFLMEDNRFINCNQKTLEMYGISYEQVIGATPDVISPELQPDGTFSKEKALVYINNAYAGKPQFFEWVHKKANGEEFQAEVSLNKIELHGKVFLQAIVRDITERKKAENAIKLSEEKFAMTFRTSPDSLTLTNLATGILEDVNKGFEKIFGYTRDEVVGRRTTEFGLWVDPKDRDFVIETIKNNDRVTEIIVQGRRKSGEVMIGQVSAELIKTAGESLILTIVRDITEKKMAEEELRLSEERFSLAFRTSPDSLTLTNISDGRIIDVNYGFERVFGYSVSEIIGVSTLELGIWRYTEDRERMINILKKDGYVRDMEATGKRKNGELFDGLISSEILKTGNESLILTIVRDITEKKKAEEALRESEEKYRTLFQNSALAVGMRSLGGSFIEFNKSYTDMLGYSSEELSRLTQMDITHPDDYKITSARMNLVAEGKSPVEQYEKRYIHKNGSTIWADVCIQPIKDKNGKIQMIIGTVINTTERKKAEESLRQNEERFRAIVNGLTDMIIVVNKQGLIEYLSPSVYKTLGYNEYEMVGKNPLDFVHKDDFSEISNELATVFSGVNRGNVSLYRVIHKEGFYIYFESVGKNMSDNKYIDGVVIFAKDVTERIKAETALRESEQRFRNLVNSLQYPIIILSFEGIVQYANPASNIFVGINPDISLIGESFTSFISPEYIGRGIEELKQIEIMGGPIFSDYKIITKNGEIKWVYVTGIKMNYEGKPADLISITDITERKAFEIELIESEERAHRQRTAIAELALDESLIKEDLLYGIKKLCKVVSFVMKTEHVSVWSLSDDESELICMAKYLACKDTYIDEYYQPAANFPNYYKALRSDSIIDAMDAQNDPRTIELKNEYLLPHGIVSLLDSAIQLEGRLIGVFSIEHVGQPRKWLPDEKAFISSLSALISQWITNAARKKAEGEIKILSKAIEQNPVEVIITDPDGNISYVNPKFTEITGYEPNDVLGKNPRILKSGEHNEEFYKDLWSTILSGRHWTGELHNKKKNGENYWESALISPILNEKDEITHFVAIKEDITEKRKLYNEIVSAKEKAEENDRLKTAFLQNMSHEIRTPLNGIIGFSSLLSEEELSREEITNYTSVIQSSGKRLLEIVNNVLEISKIETGQVVVLKKLFSVNSLLSDLYSFFSSQAKLKKLALSYQCSLDETHSIVYSDESKLNQILINLLNNAVKFTKSGSIEYGYTKEDNVLKFYVRDTGIGIPEEKFGQVFERFTQADISASREYEGTGLGLAICKGLIELLGGVIWVESVIDAGTVFYFTIPFYTENIPIISESKDKTESKINGNHGTIIIAEDDFTSVEYYRNVLKNYNLKILHARDGAEALELLRNNITDLVLMDMRMPVMDGFQTIPEMKKIMPGIPIIAQTAYAFSEEREKILALGCEDYVAKPIQKETLIEIIRKYINLD